MSPTSPHPSLCCCRPRASGHSHVTNLTLGRLTKQQMRELIESRLHGVSDKLVERIAARTDGVPLFIEELTRSILESGDGSSDNVHIPDSLQGSLMARLDRLPPAPREVAQIASVIDREFDRSLLAEVVTCDPAVLDDALRQLWAAISLMPRSSRAIPSSLSMGQEQDEPL